MNITQAAHSFLHDRLEAIARGRDVGALQALLAGVDLPALSGTDEPAEQITRALETGNDFAGLARRLIPLLAKLLRIEVETLKQQLTALVKTAVGSNTLIAPATSPLLKNETYVFNLFLLVSRLPRDPGLFDGLHEFHRIGLEYPVLATTHNRVGYQLRHALAEQQTDSTLEKYWLGLLSDKKREWNPGRRTELLEAWRGILGLLDFDRRFDASMQLLDQGFRILHDTVEPRRESVGLLQMAFWRLETAFPFDSPTWVRHLKPYWKTWPQLLHDLAIQTWPGFEPESLTNIYSLPNDLARLWCDLPEKTQDQLRELFKNKAAEQGRKLLLNDLLFLPPKIEKLSPQEVAKLIQRLADHLWPEGKETPHTVDMQPETAEWKETPPARARKKVSMDRISALESVNKALGEIERCLERGDENTARGYLNDLLEQQRRQPIADRNVHIAKTLAKAAAIVKGSARLEWAETLLREACAANTDDEIAASGLADVLKAQGRLDDAEHQYRQNVARWPHNEVTANGLAYVLKAQGRLDDAEHQYRQNVARWPHNEVTANGLAYVLKAQGRLDDAEHQYRQNVARWPHNEVTANGLAYVLKAQGQLDDAEHQYRQNVARWPHDEFAANGLADVLKAQGRLDDAEHQYRQNVARWPHNEVAANGLADVLKAQGRLDDAEHQYRQNVARWPHDEVTANGLADVLKAQGQLDDAEHQYRQNVARWPHDEFAASGLADVLKAQGQLDDAEHQYRQNVARWPHDEFAASGLANVLKAQGRLDDAEHQYRQNVARWPHDEFAASGLANVLKAQGRLDDAEHQYRQNVARWPHNEVAANGLADVLKAQGRLDDAERQYRQNVTRWPHDEFAASGLANVLKAQGQLDDAERQYRQNVARWPHDEVAASGLADVLKAQGQLDDAERQYRQNVARWPHDEFAANGLADVLKAQGQLDDAEHQYRQNVARWPHDEVAANGLADVLKAQGRLDDAEHQYRQNVARWVANRVSVNGLANVLRKLKRHAEALNLLPTPTASFLLAQDFYDLHTRGMILLDLGRINDARQALEQGLQAASTPVCRNVFQRGLALLEIRVGSYERVSENLAGLSGNLIPLELYRLHAEAAQRHGEIAGRLLRSLNEKQDRMRYDERKTLELIRNGYGLTEAGPQREPSKEGFEEIFEAEIEMELAA